MGPGAVSPRQKRRVLGSDGTNGRHRIRPGDTCGILWRFHHRKTVDHHGASVAPVSVPKKAVLRATGVDENNATVAVAGGLERSCRPACDRPDRRPERFLEPRGDLAEEAAIARGRTGCESQIPTHLGRVGRLRAPEQPAVACRAFASGVSTRSTNVSTVILCEATPSPRPTPPEAGGIHPRPGRRTPAPFWPSRRPDSRPGFRTRR